MTNARKQNILPFLGSKQQIYTLVIKVIKHTIEKTGSSESVPFDATHICIGISFPVTQHYWFDFAKQFDSTNRMKHIQSQRNMERMTTRKELSGDHYFLFSLPQATFGAYVYSYAVKGAVHIKPSHAAYLNSLFWVSA